MTAIRRHSINQDANNLIKGYNENFCQSSFSYINVNSPCSRGDCVCVVDDSCILEYGRVVLMKAINVFVDMSQEPFSQLYQSNNCLSHLIDSSLF